MRKVITKHKLSVTELQSLQTAIGCTVQSISSVFLSIGLEDRTADINGAFALNLGVQKLILFNYIYAENEMGDDSYETNISMTDRFAGVDVNNQKISNPTSHVRLLNEFVIQGIEVLGFSYEYKREVVEKGQPLYLKEKKVQNLIYVTVSTEHIICLQSEKGETLLIYPRGGFTTVTTDKELIKKLLLPMEDHDIPNYQHIELKHSLH